MYMTTTSGPGRAHTRLRVRISSGARLESEARAMRRTVARTQTVTRTEMGPPDAKATGTEQACWAPGGLFCRIKLLVLLLLILGIVLEAALTSG